MAKLSFNMQSWRVALAYLFPRLATLNICSREAVSKRNELVRNAEKFFPLTSLKFSSKSTKKCGPDLATLESCGRPTERKEK